ncbi:MAG: oligosaccharide flippase family protein [Muribaculaceae bacterium]|nr:oligosaccharide flippase family protein [Muribaculaceae bacterium]
MSKLSQHKGKVGSATSARVMKLMGIFSGLQMLTIICSVVKMKLVALWLGTIGVGLFGIYQSVIDTTSTITNMGLQQSSVRDVAAAKTPSRLALVVRMIRRWSCFSAILGAVVMAALAIPLGHWFFGSDDAWLGFLLLSIAMFLNALCNGEQAILQGSDQLKALAKANLYGTVGGLLLSIPMFYFCGYISVPLSIIVYSVILYISLISKRLRVIQVSVPDVHKRSMPRFVKLGLYMASAAFLTSLAHTIFIGILNYISTTSEVGLVQAGDTLVVRYIGLLFTAIGMEFYPRVAANHRHKSRLQVFVNHEIMLLMICLIPLLCLFMLVRVPIIRILYTEEFLPIIPFVSWAAISCIPKAVSWCMAYMILAKGEGRIYIFTEGLDALISVPLCLVAYHLHGLTGLGIAYIVWYLIYSVITGYVFYKRYQMRLNRSTLRITLIAFVITIAYLFGMQYLPWWVMAIVFLPISLPSLLAIRKF